MKSLTQHIEEKLCHRIDEKLVINKDTKIIDNKESFVYAIKANGLIIEKDKYSNEYYIYPTQKDGMRLGRYNTPDPHLAISMHDTYFSVSDCSGREVFDVWGYINGRDMKYELSYSDLDTDGKLPINKHQYLIKILYTVHNADVISKFMLNIAKEQK